MRATILTVILVTIAALIGAMIGFGTAAFALPRQLLDDYNTMASENFQTALTLFRHGHHDHQAVLFGEQEDYATFEAGGVTFHVIPASETTAGTIRGRFNAGIGNTANHMNGMVVMLACKWIEDDNPAEEVLLDRLKEHIPNFRLSSHGLRPVRVADLAKGSAIVKSKADQWEWRMAWDSQGKHSAEPAAVPRDKVNPAEP